MLRTYVSCFWLRPPQQYQLIILLTFTDSLFFFCVTWIIRCLMLHLTFKSCFCFCNNWKHNFFIKYFYFYFCQTKTISQGFNSTGVFQYSTFPPTEHSPPMRTRKKASILWHSIHRWMRIFQKIHKDSFLITTGSRISWRKSTNSMSKRREIRTAARSSCRALIINLMTRKTGNSTRPQKTTSRTIGRLLPAELEMNPNRG